MWYKASNKTVRDEGFIYIRKTQNIGFVMFEEKGCLTT